MGHLSEVSTEYGALKLAARTGQLSRRELVRRGIALGLGAPALAGLLTSFRGFEARAQAAEPAGPDAVKGKTYDMSILGIAGWPPSHGPARGGRQLGHLVARYRSRGLESAHARAGE